MRECGFRGEGDDIGDALVLGEMQPVIVLIHLLRGEFWMSGCSRHFILEEVARGVFLVESSSV